jgi:multiple sugar transport system substrate-binding protein
MSVCSLVIAACGSSGGGGSSAGGKTTMTWFMWTGSSAEVQAWKHLADMVTAKYPDITLNFQTTSFTDYWTKLAAEVSGGNAPCILGMQSLRTPQFGSLLQPLNSLMAKYGVNTSQFNQSIINGLKSNGQQVAVPYDFGPLVVYYNKNAFQKAGLAMPGAGWTTAQFLADAKKLTGGKQYGFAAFPYPDWIIPWSMSNEGFNPVTASGTTQFTSPKFEQAMQWYVNLVQKEKVSSPVPSTNDPTWPINQYLSGNAAMIVDGPWDLINTKAQAKFGVGIAPMPAGAGGSQTVSAGSGFGISANCKTPDQAMQAISVITSPAALKYLGEQGRAFPARTAEQKYWYKNAVPGAQATLTEALKGAVPYLTTTKWNSISQLFVQYGVQAMNGQMSVPNFINTVNSQAGGS